jgi:hypothetical protein
MEDPLRKSGIGIIGNLPWGSRLCLFYRTPAEMLDILVPYFRTGLENNEFCLWLTAQPLDQEAAAKALRESAPDYNEYIAKGQIAILPYSKWYFKDGSLDLPGVARNWDTKLSQTFAKGFSGLRAAFNSSWLEKKDWQPFMKFEVIDEDDINKNLSIWAESTMGKGSIIQFTLPLAAVQPEKMDRETPKYAGKTAAMQE